MTAEEVVVARLGATNGVTALVGTRIYPLEIPQSSPMPAIVYQKISAGFLPTLRRTLGLAGPRIQITSWADTYTAAKAVAKQVRQALDGYNSGGVYALILDERDLSNPSTLREGVSQDYSIWVDTEA